VALCVRPVGSYEAVTSDHVRATTVDHGVQGHSSDGDWHSDEVSQALFFLHEVLNVCITVSGANHDFVDEYDDCC
jgi:hypothetical protein